MRILGLLASVLAAMLLIAACGGGDDDDSGANGDDGDAPELTENDLAEAMLLVLGDLPAGEDWEYEPPSDIDEDDEPDPFDQCDRDNEDSIIGTADGGDFSHGTVSEISQDIRIFDSVDSLAKDLDDIEDRADCMADLVSDGALDTESATYSGFKMDRVEYRQFGDNSRAYRIEMTAALIDEPNVPDPFKIYLDQIFVEIGTVGMRISASDVFEPYDEDEVGRIVALGEEKVRDILANGPGDATSDGNGDADGDGDDEPTATRISATEPPDETDGAGTGTSSFQDPVPLGQSGVLVDRVEVSVVDVNFDAWALVEAENLFNDPPEPGKRMVLIRLEFTNVGTDPYDIFFDPSFNLVGDKAVAYDEFADDCGVIPDEVTGEIFPGGTKQGNICLQADEDDSGLVAFLSEYDEDFDEQRLFLALQ